MSYTHATIIVPAASRDAARALLGEPLFAVGASPTGTAPATHYVAAGPFDNAELSALAESGVEHTTLPSEDARAHLAGMGLQIVAEPSA